MLPKLNQPLWPDGKLSLTTPLSLILTGVSAWILAKRNRERREVDYAMADQARQRFTDQPGWETRKSIVLYSPEWHKGIIGISASRMTEAFHKPSVILTHSNDRAVGSARSVPGFDLYAALQQCEDLFYSYGGHAHAAGMQMPVENVEAFAERFESIACEQISPENTSPLLDVCARIRLEDITPGMELKGTVLNVVAGVGKISMEDVTRGIGPFLLAESIVLFLMVMFPQIIMWPAKLLY